AAVVTPGLIDAHTVVPMSGALNLPADQDQDEMSDPNQADLRVLDAFNPGEPLLEFLRSQGVTVVHAVPGRSNVIDARSGLCRTHESADARGHPDQPRRGAEAGVPEQAADDAHGHRGPGPGGADTGAEQRPQARRGQGPRQEAAGQPEAGGAGAGPGAQDPR